MPGKIGNKNAATHGMKHKPVYETWHNMKARCLNKSHKSFKEYGGRGISVCKSWMKFENFYKDMGDRPEGKTLERIDNQKGYSPKNCKWASVSEQGRNKRNNVILKAYKLTLSVVEWSEVCGIKADTLYQRVGRGWSHEDVVTKPVRQRK